MVCALVIGLSGLGSSPSRRQCVCVLGQDTLLSRCLSSSRVIRVIKSSFRERRIRHIKTTLFIIMGLKRIL